MSVPVDVIFDRYATLSRFLSVDNNLPLTIGLNGMALVTSFLAAGVYGNWVACSDPVSTSWTAMPTFSTVWTIDPNGV